MNKAEVIKEDSRIPREISALTNKLSELLEKADKKELFTNKQNIKINMDGKKEINVKGIEGLSETIRRGFEKQMKNVPSKAETRMLGSTIESIIRRLRDIGIDGV